MNYDTRVISKVSQRGQFHPSLRKLVTKSSSPRSMLEPILKVGQNFLLPCQRLRGL